MVNEQALSQWQKDEETARHGVFASLLILTLANLDIMARTSEIEKKRATQTWISWGTIFVLLVFFIINPEQELLRK